MNKRIRMVCKTAVVQTFSQHAGVSIDNVVWQEVYSDYSVSECEKWIAQRRTKGDDEVYAIFTMDGIYKAKVVTI